MRTINWQTSIALLYLALINLAKASSIGARYHEAFISLPAIKQKIHPSNLHKQKSLDKKSGELYSSKNTQITKEANNKRKPYNGQPQFNIPDFPSLQTSASRFLRIKPSMRNGKRVFELQTAVQTFEKPIIRSSGMMETASVDLHAQVHFGDEEYFAFYNDQNKFSSRYDRVHYELIVDENLLTTAFNDNNNNKSNKKLIRTLLMPENGLMPSMADTQTALQYDLSCQVDLIDFSQPNWVCADLSREEFYSMQQKKRTNQKNKLSNLPGVEVLDALIRPTTPASSGIKTQLFSNLFLPGASIASFFRSILWTTVPSPELSVMLLDWSSSSPKAGGISPIATPVIESLLTGKVGAARKLVFSQMLVSGQADEGSNQLLIGGRNDHALRVLMHSINTDECQSNALMYGALHCRDLQKKLSQLGFQRKKVQWRTAWSVDAPGLSIGNNNEGWNVFASVGVVGVPFYLAIGGLDWVATIEELIKAFEVGNWGDGFFATILYIARHVALYLGLAKFVIEWDGTNTGTGWGNKRR